MQDFMKINEILLKIDVRAERSQRNSDSKKIRVCVNKWEKPKFLHTKSHMGHLYYYIWVCV